MAAARTKSLAALGLTAQGGRESQITGLSVDSRLVKPGHLFAALPGVNVHGVEFVPYALRMDAGAVLTDIEGAPAANEALEGTDIPLIVVEDARQALAYAAALWFETQPEVVVATTGTNGKTSVANFLQQIWTLMGMDAMALGTMGVSGAYTQALNHTTPEPITLHRLLRDGAKAGVTHAAMEASSHGLAQRRLDGVRLTAAAFTNFTQDHLDYHETFEEYFGAKAGLFSRVLPEGAQAVINLDDPRGAEMASLAEDRGATLLTVGKNERADLRIHGQRFDATGQELNFSWGALRQTVRLDLIGGFQAENIVVAAGLAIASGGDPQDVFRVLPELQTVRGRMALAATRANGAAVFVDYAHTPDAVETALKALRPHVMGKIVIVLGAGGDRDPGKRILMGQAAAAHGDVVFVTDDNPRSEEPSAIRAMVIEGCREAVEVGDRAEAILRGVDALSAGDALLIAGKGHETGQTVGDDVLPFDDAEQASIAVAALDGVA